MTHRASEAPTALRRPHRARPDAARQPSLFFDDDIETPGETPGETPAETQAQTQGEPPRDRLAATPRPVARVEVKPHREPDVATAPASAVSCEITTIGEADMPHSPPDLVEATRRALAELPAERVWFGYRDIRTYFCVSRATVCRRMKEGCVPRVRLQAGRVLEEGAVRRFDRAQLLWLLLSVRAGRHR